MFHVEQIMSNPETQKANQKKGIVETVNYFYAGILDGKLRTYKELEKKFNSYHVSITKDEMIRAWEKVIKITEWSKAEKIVIGDINKSYIYISESSNQISGTINYIVVNDNHNIILLYFDLSDKRLDESYLSRKLKYTLDYFGFEKVFGKRPDFIKVHSVKYDEDYVFYKTEDDRKRLDLTIDNVCHCIEHQIIYPRETYLCKSCQYSNYCTFWCKGGEKDVRQ